MTSLGTIAASALPDLYRTAQLCLLAARPVGYTTGQRWHNHGTTGHTCNAWPVSVTHEDYIPPGTTYAAPNGDSLPGPGFVVAAGQTGPTEDRIFEINGTPLDPGDDTKPFTATIAFTPIYINTTTPSPPNPPPAPPPSPFGIRFMWKYACSSLPPSPDGLVIENVNAVPNLLNPAVTDYGNFLPGAIYNGAKDSPFPCSQSFTPGVFLGARSEQGDFIEHTRQVISLRYDPIVAREVALWRNAALLRPPTPIGANEGPWLDATNLYLGSGQICHAVLWHDRALTDDQISSLHTRLTTSR